MTIRPFKSKANLKLVIALSVPLFFVAILLLIVYIPNWVVSENPQHDFLYAVNSAGPRVIPFEVDENGKVVHQRGATNDVQFYVYRADTRLVTEMNLEEINSKYRLNPERISPDGFEIAKSHDSRFPLFFLDDLYIFTENPAFYLTNDISLIKVEVDNNNYFYFLGWVEKK